jgi:hypothetical protein
MRFTIDKVILEQVLNYLAMKPYNEVAQLIATIQQNVKVVDEPTAPVANP